MNTFLQKHALMIGWVQAVVATVGSLFLSIVMQFPPCDLCWYQRIAMYPLIVILGIGIIKKDRNCIFYAYPLALVGFLIAFFHNLLYYNILPEAAAPCKAGISCTAVYIEWFGFITIPLLSLIAFAVILFCLKVVHKGYTQNSQ